MQFLKDTPPPLLTPQHQRTSSSPSTFTCLPNDSQPTHQSYHNHTSNQLFSPLSSQFAFPSTTFSTSSLPPWPNRQDLPPSFPSHSQFPSPHHFDSNSSSTSTSLLPYSGIRNGLLYTLICDQQPVRARMCGFGDKDRRPISPPTCVKLLITDIKSGKEVDSNDIDGSYFILTVDLWSVDGTHEVNLAKHAAGNSSLTIPSTLSFSLPHTHTPVSSMSRPSHPPDSCFQTPAISSQSLSLPTIPPPHSSSSNPPHSDACIMYSHDLSLPDPPLESPHPIAYPISMHSRNLIGNLTVNASKLIDPKGKPGFWFILQDLSVRTEGYFRLKMSFIDLGSGSPTSPSLNTDKASVLASVFSDPFQVYSAKKFPGVLESTPLSRTFARQGVKIPIRRESHSRARHPRHSSSPPPSHH